MAKAAKPQTLGQMIDQLDTIREAKRVLASSLKVQEEAYSLLEEEIKQRLGKEGMSKATGTSATVSLSEVIVANVDGPDGWDKFCAFVKKTGYFQLFQRRVSDPAFREIMGLKGAVPGLVPFTKTNLNLRSNSKEA